MGHHKDASDPSFLERVKFFSDEYKYERFKIDDIPLTNDEKNLIIAVAATVWNDSRHFFHLTDSRTCMKEHVYDCTYRSIIRDNSKLSYYKDFPTGQIMKSYPRLSVGFYSYGVYHPPFSFQVAPYIVSIIFFCLLVIPIFLLSNEDAPYYHGPYIFIPTSMGLAVIALSAILYLWYIKSSTVKMRAIDAICNLIYVDEMTSLRKSGDMLSYCCYKYLHGKLNKNERIAVSSYIRSHHIFRK